MFSKTCEYGIKATLHIANRSLTSGDKIRVKEIAKGINSPVAFTAKILQILSRNEIVYSVKGPMGGFYIPEERLKEIKLNDIVKSLSGDSVYFGCALGLEQCSDSKPCPLHHKFKQIRSDLEEMLTTTSLFELAVRLDSGLTFLKP